MRLPPFQLERFFARYEFTARYLLCTSDCEPLDMQELLSMAGEEMMKLWENLKLGYTESQGNSLLRKEISGLYSRLQPVELLVLTPEEGIFIAMNCMLQAGDQVVCTYPGYQSLYEIARSLGCSLSFWKPVWENGWRFRMEDLLQQVKKETRLLVINFPHNPTGVSIGMADFEAIMQLARERNMLVFSDEMYRLLEQDSTQRLPAACDLLENAVSLSGLSKSFALAGLRIGWLATRNRELFKRFATYRDYTTICNSAPSELLALVALQNKERILERNLQIIRTNLDILDSFFREYADRFHWYRPQAGTVAFPALAPGLNVQAFCADLLEKTGVLLLPATELDFEGNFFRIGFARKNMPDALREMGKYLW